jgi:predicted nuclease of predicted toxin-antitoxin system
VKAVVDAQWPPALAWLFTAKGLDAVHVEDLGLREANDAPNRAWALAHAAVVVTKDRDFVEDQKAYPALRVLWLRTGNLPNAALFALIEARWAAIEGFVHSEAPILEITT